MDRLQDFLKTILIYFLLFLKTKTIKLRSLLFTKYRDFVGNNILFKNEIAKLKWTLAVILHNQSKNLQSKFRLKFYTFHTHY